MRVRFRLHQLLTRHGQSRHGLIMRITNATGIERHKVSRLLDEEEDKVSLTHLSALCRFLIDECNVDPRELPGALFELEPSRFLSLLRGTPQLRTCFGVRQRSEVRPDAPWAAGTDSLLHGKLLELLLCPEPLPTKSQSAEGEPADGFTAARSRSASSQRWPLRIQHFHQEQVHAASALRLNDEPDPDAPPPTAAARAELRKQRTDELNLIREDAERVYRVLHAPRAGAVADDRQHAVGHAALLLGTLKSNPACELATAEIFGAVPWGEHGRPARGLPLEGTPDLVKTPRERAVPYFIRYRDRANSGMIDPRIPSCHAGTQLARGKVTCGNNAQEAGIYYETPGGRWEYAPWTLSDRDAALLTFQYDRMRGNVQVLLGGFSSRATLLLAAQLEFITRSLLPHTLDGEPPYTEAYITPQRAVGAFVIEFRIDPTETREQDGIRVPQLTEPPRVIPLQREVLAPRLEPLLDERL